MRKDSLAKHVKKNVCKSQSESVKIWQCEHCGKSFSIKSSWMRHVNKAHLNAGEEVTDEDTEILEETVFNPIFATKLTVENHHPVFSDSEDETVMESPIKKIDVHNCLVNVTQL